MIIRVFYAKLCSRLGLLATATRRLGIIPRHTLPIKHLGALVTIHELDFETRQDGSLADLAVYAHHQGERGAEPVYSMRLRLFDDTEGGRILQQQQDDKLARIVSSLAPRLYVSQNTREELDEFFDTENYIGRFMLIGWSSTSLDNKIEYRKIS